MDIPTPLKVLVSLCIIVMIGLCFFFVDWQKKMAEKKELDLTLSAKTTEHEQQLILAQELPIEKKRNEALRQEVRGMMSELFTPETEGDFVPSYIANMERLVEQLQVSLDDKQFFITVLNPGSTVTESEDAYLTGVPKKKFQIQLSGRYFTIVNFLQQLGALGLKRLVTIDRISLAPSGATGSGYSPTLSVTMPMTAYMRPGQ
jgi:Tfp pilus assembly protein PilO